jgi:hypothetical protein
MLRDLARREINELHVEAGHKLNGSFIREGLVDEFLVYLAPQLLGPAKAWPICLRSPSCVVRSNWPFMRWTASDPICACCCAGLEAHSHKSTRTVARRGFCGRPPLRPNLRSAFGLGSRNSKVQRLHTR